MPALMWFVLQRVIAAMLTVLLFDAFRDAHAWLDVWKIFSAMPGLLQIGVVTTVLVVLYVVAETLAYLWRACNAWWKGPKDPSTGKKPRKYGRTKAKRRMEQVGNEPKTE